MKKCYYTAKDIYAIDRYTIETIGIPSPVLMERAAYSIYQQLTENISSTDTILLIVGAGNNGGDGIALARMLHIKGYSASIYCLNPDSIHPLQTHIAQQVGVPFIDSLDKVLPTIIVDALFGIGISRQIEGKYADLIHWINQQAKARIIAIDLPSGLSADLGHPMNLAVRADTTYTIGFLKQGMHTKEGKALCGNIHICDIGYPNTLLKAKLDLDPLIK